jgi:hypothetical protein
MNESSRGEHLVDVLIAIAKSDYPQEWSRYGELAQKLAQEVEEQAIEFSAEDCARRLLIGHYRCVLGHGLTAGMLSQLLGGEPSELQKMTWEATRLEQIFRDRLILLIHAGAYSLSRQTRWHADWGDHPFDCRCEAQSPSISHVCRLCSGGIWWR